ncbi:uroporphyrinogen-III synthase [Tilletia horrida]|uniref:Uroporphyrinogen-III synthase n=1 Tax=Tilletia horrida TaxID=155126 RepID=A0AAN6JRY1_9BASI|nr:uroporphyrinogen-III synthase [Tilletia horrida]KAK0546472.1 uroporphyrinogen-III synthase [Tilletia horrida]KAK0562249.1 uroporphyrinogen-III synthase [Tilletia horrida]
MVIKLVSVVLFRTPVPTSQGTDPWHDAFGPFCLPSFPISALESGTSSPLPPVALTASGLPSRKPRPTSYTSSLTTHHLHLVTPTQPDDAASSTSSVDDDQSEASNSVRDSQQQSSSRTQRRPSSSSMTPLRRPTIETTEFAVTSIPILASLSCNQSPLVGAILNRQWAGVVCTSQRAVQAWAEALSSIVHEAVHEYERSQRKPEYIELPGTTTAWNRVPFFTVGPATSTALKKIIIGPPVGSSVSPRQVAIATASILPRSVLGGKSTGTAEHLARFILNFFDCTAGDDDQDDNEDDTGAEEGEQNGNKTPREDPDTTARPPSPSEAGPQQGQASPSPSAYAIPNPLLLLQGDKALPTLPEILSTARPHPIPFETIKVYETGMDPHFEAHVESHKTMLARARGVALSRRNSGRSSRRPSGNWSTNPGTASGGSGSGFQSIGGGAGGSADAKSMNAPGGVISAVAGLQLDGMPRRGSASSALSMMSTTSSAAMPNSVDGSIDPTTSAAIVHTVSGLHQSAPSVVSLRPDWIVFYSPSGVKYALEALRKNDWIPPPAQPLLTETIVASPASTPTSESVPNTNSSSSSSSTPSPLSASSSSTETDATSLESTPQSGGHPKGHSVPAGSNSAVLSNQSSFLTSYGSKHPTPLTPAHDPAPPKVVDPVTTYPRIATLGPTTARWIIENLGHEGVRVDVVAAQPSPDALKEAICAFEAGLRDGDDGVNWTLRAHGLQDVVPGAAVTVEG